MLRHRIVVGTDGSERSRHALRWAAREAQVREARLIVVHAWLTPPQMSSLGPMVAPIDLSDYEQVGKEVLEADISDVVESTGFPESSIEPVLVRRYAPAALLERASTSDLLVVGSRGRGGFKGLLLGSVSQHCVAHSTVPVAVVRFEAPLPDDGDVVVGVDGSIESGGALRFAIQEAARRHAHLVVAHGWWVDFPHSTAEALPFVSIDRDEYRGRSRNLMLRMLDEASVQLGRRPKDVEVVPLEDTAARALVSLSANAGLLVVGSRGRGSITGVLLGSVSQQCVHHAHTTVVVVPTPPG